jgi:hypothetical protein
MHIAGAWLTTNNTQARKVKITKAQQEEIERGWRERNNRLKSMGLPKQTLEEYTDWLYGRGKKEKKAVHSSSPKYTTSQAPRRSEGGTTESHNARSKVAELSGEPRSLGSWVTGAVSSKPSPQYTGSKILGIGTMHKSNAVPIFTDEEAKDVARMRR